MAPPNHERSTSTVHVPLNDLESGADSRHISKGAGLSQTPDNWIDQLDLMLSKLTIALTPSFLQHWVGGQPPQQSRLHGFAALDGVRGWACLLVFNFHFLFTYTWKVAVGWGFAGENFGILHLPIIHLLISGHIMVAIFFVLSGYVLSYKPLKLMRSRSWDQVFTTLASATFRRGLRLYIPSIVGIFFVFVAVRLGVYNYSHMVVNRGQTIQGTNEQHPPVMKSFQRQFRDWYLTVVHLIDPWNWALYYNYYNPHLWTIPVEFRCSIVLFVTMLATSRLVSTVRMAAVAGLTWFCMRWGRWDVVHFLFGMLMAELDLINGTWEKHQQQRDDEKPAFPLTAPKLPPKLRISSRRFWLGVFVFGLYLGSSPNTGYKWTPFYMWTAKLTPKTYPEPHRFPQTIGAALIVFSINRSKSIQSLFTNDLSQYLGKISFAFYIVHGPILHSLGYSIMPNIWNIVGKETDFQYCLGFFIGWLICLPISIWAGDVFWRAVDVPSVRFSRWLEDKLIVKGGLDERV